MNRVQIFFANPTTKKVGIGAAIVAGGSGIVWGIKHFIGAPLAAGAKSFKESFAKSYAEERALKEAKAA